VERNARALLSLLPLLLATSGCIVDLGNLGEEDTDGTESTDGDGGSSTAADTGDSGSSDDGTTMPIPTERAVDILFVIDNSGSMGEEQAKLASSIEALVSTLDGAAMPVDYRIGVTTTDNGNPWCGTTSPEAGSLRATSCRSRPTEFTFNGAVVIEAFDDACAALCPEELADLEISDGKPWIDVQNTTGTSNVDAVVDSLRCMLPQGIDGCGFESQLESTWKAVGRFDAVGDASFGFHRPGALLAVMIISDETDCSYNQDVGESIFLPDGDRTFWSDPTAASPTSAVCWNAGMACTELGDGTLDCVSQDFDLDGNTGASPAEAVLHPVKRYIDTLVAEGAFVSGIYGVGLDGSAVFRTSDDPQYQNDFGIGAGCESENGKAVPPGRMREVVTALDGSGTSICAGGFELPLMVFGQGILSRLP